MKKTGALYKLVPGFLSQRGKVLHHSTAWNPKRNEYLVAFDFDVDGDNLPDQLFALRVDTNARIVDKRMLNFTANLNGKAGIVWIWKTRKSFYATSWLSTREVLWCVALCMIDSYDWCISTTDLMVWRRLAEADVKEGSGVFFKPSPPPPVSLNLPFPRLRH